MINLTNKVLIQEFGQNTEFYNFEFPKLELFFFKNKNKFQKEPFYSLIKGKSSDSILNKENQIQIFLSSIYLFLIIERILLKYLQLVHISKKKNLETILKLFFPDNIFISFKILNFETDYSSEFENFDFLENFIKLTDNKLEKFSLQPIEADIFGDLYQHLIFSNNRHETGEYFTPKWLIEEILNDIWDEIKAIKQKKSEVKILDPACGSGSILISILVKGLKSNFFESIDDILISINGFDINSFSLFMCKVNFVLVICNLDIYSDIKYNNNNSNILKKSINSNNHLFLNLDTLIYKKNEKSLLSFTESLEKLENLKNYDFIIGNPPWMTLRAIKDNNYQEKVKKEIFEYKLLKKSETHLFTQMEIATLFYNKAIDLFGTKNAFICFLMPKSVILNTNHTVNFRKFENPHSTLLKIWDLQKINNLFGMPTCVLFAKKGGFTNYPVDIFILKGKIEVQKLEENKIRDLEITQSKYSPTEINSIKSYYYDKFKVGASIFPRNLYFITIKNQNNEFVEVETDATIDKIAKSNWKNINVNGLVNEKFVFSTLLSWELIPFGYTSLRLILLPIHITNEKSILISNEVELDENSQKWFQKTEIFWKRNQTEKSKIRFYNLNQRLNYNNLLINQDLKKNFIVLFSGTGSNICSCVISRENLYISSFKNIHFIADVKTWIFETEDEGEAFYLCSILNSPILNELIKPLQPQGLGGGRAIHRRPLQFPIPKYNSENIKHSTLSNIGKIAHEKIKKIVNNDIIKSRKESRNILKTELNEINIICKSIFDQN